jgi:hypothetical protein
MIRAVRLTCASNGLSIVPCVLLNGSNALHVSRLLDQGASEPRFNRLSAFALVPARDAAARNCAARSAQITCCGCSLCERLPFHGPSDIWTTADPLAAREYRFGALGGSVVGAIGGYVGGYLLDAAMVLNGSNALHVSRLLDRGASEPRFNRLQ